MASFGEMTAVMRLCCADETVDRITNALFVSPSTDGVDRFVTRIRP